MWLIRATFTTAASVVESPVIFSGDSVLSSSTFVNCLRSCKTLEPVLFDGVLTACTLDCFRRTVARRRTGARREPLKHVVDIPKLSTQVVRQRVYNFKSIHADESAQGTILPEVAWGITQMCADVDTKHKMRHTSMHHPIFPIHPRVRWGLAWPGSFVNPGLEFHVDQGTRHANAFHRRVAAFVSYRLLDIHLTHATTGARPRCRGRCDVRSYVCAVALSLWRVSPRGPR